MKNIILISVATLILAIAFVISFNWANGLDYSPIDQSMAPIAITWLIGVFGISSLGGIFGAIWEYNEAN